jgi:hypothetical protein
MTTLTSCIGAMVPPLGKSPFDEGDLVLLVQDARGIIRVGDEHGQRTIRCSMNAREWQELLQDGQAVAFNERPFGTATSAWMFRPWFDSRATAISELRWNTGGILTTPIINIACGVEGHTLVCLVHRSKALPIRANWARQAMRKAKDRARVGQWETMLLFAEQAVALTPGLNPRALALLITACEATKQATRAESYLRVAENNLAPELLKDLQDLREQLRVRFGP